MKKLLLGMIVLGLLFVVGCGLLWPEGMHETHATQPSLPFAIDSELPEGHSFAPYYAKTPEYFYAVVWGDGEWPRTYYIYRAPLSDISTYEQIFQSEEHRSISIFGVSAQGLYIHSWYNNDVEPYDEIHFLLHGSDQTVQMYAGALETWPETVQPENQAELEINGMHFGVRRYEPEGIPIYFVVADDVRLHRLDDAGEVVETILEWTEWDNNAVTMHRLGDMILLTEFLAGGGEWITFFALYDPATGALFATN